MQERITHALVKGIDAFIVEDVEEARQLAEKPIEVIEAYYNLDLINKGEVFRKLQEMFHDEQRVKNHYGLKDSLVTAQNCTTPILQRRW